MPKAYKVSDLFFTDWKQLSTRKHAQLYGLLIQLRDVSLTDPKAEKLYGMLLISVLRQLRRRPLLVDKINEAQAVDCFNELTFLNDPWYFFPQLKRPGLPDHMWKTPDEKMAKHTFDHFIYADNEYSRFVATQDTKYLYRLAATLYQHEFDKEEVERIGNRLMKRAPLHDLMLVFFTYGHIRNLVTSRCKTLLPKTEGGDNKKTTATGPMWLKLKHRLAETPAFHGYYAAGKANMYAALDYLEDLAQQKEHAKS